MVEHTNHDRRKILKSMGVPAMLALAGCLGEDSDGNDGNGGDGDWTGNVDSIEFLTWHLGFIEDSALGYAEDFEAEYGVEAEWIDQSADNWIQWFQSRVSSDNPPALANVAPEYYPGYVEDGVTADIEEVASDEMMEQLEEKLSTNQLDSRRVDGTLYGLPWYSGSGAFYYWNEYFDEIDVEIGLENPHSIQEILDMSEEAARSTDADYAILGPNLRGWYLRWMHAWEPRIRVLTEDQSEVAFDNENTVELISRLRELTQDGLIPELQWTASGSDPVVQEFAAKNAAAMNWGGWVYRIIESNAPDDYEHTQLGISAPPKHVSRLAPQTWIIPDMLGEAEKKAALHLADIITNEKWANDFVEQTSILTSNLEANREYVLSDEFQEENPALARTYEITFLIDEKDGWFVDVEVPSFSEIDDQLDTQFTSAILGDKDPEDAVSDAASEVRDILDG